MGSVSAEKLEDFTKYLVELLLSNKDQKIKEFKLDKSEEEYCIILIACICRIISKISKYSIDYLSVISFLEPKHSDLYKKQVIDLLKEALEEVESFETDCLKKFK